MSQNIPLSTRQKFRSWAEREDQNLRRASRAVGGFVLLGFAMGMLAIILKEQLLHDPASQWQHYLGILLEHGGLGLVVSSIAVFGYEWRSHARKAFELSEDLTLSIAEVGGIADVVTLAKELGECNVAFKKHVADDLRRFEEQTNQKRLARDKWEREFEVMREGKLAALKTEIEEKRSAEALVTLNYSLTELLGSDESKSRLRKHIEFIVKSAYNLKKEQTPNTVQYLNVISWLIGETVVENAITLEKLSVGTDAEWHYKVPTSAAKMAARMLGAHMKVMEPGESYDTISDVRLWENNQLKYFAEKTEQALARGVKVRRVFNLCTLDIPKTDGDKARDALDRINAIIDQHLEVMKRTNRAYSVRFFSVLDAANVQAKTGRKITDIQGANFGLFKNLSPDRIIRFVVEDISLSSMRLSYCKSDDPDVLLFEAMWNEASEVNPFH